MIFNERYSLKPLFRNFSIPTKEAQVFAVSCFLITMLVQKLSTYICTTIHKYIPGIQNSDTLTAACKVSHTIQNINYSIIKSVIIAHTEYYVLTSNLLHKADKKNSIDRIERVCKVSS
jgi:hypothetical protein